MGIEGERSMSTTTHRSGGFCLMTSRLNIAVPIFLCIPSLAANIPTPGTQGTQLTSDQRQIVETVSTVFKAAGADDVLLFKSVTTPDFYIFDGGSRFDGDGLMALVKQLHEAGKHYEWNVTEPDVHIAGNTAWIAYINKGSITDSSGRVEQEWLESAFLQKRNGAWKIVFMQSTRVPKPQPPGDPK
jgi:ketosteroid isomerase-like protein